MIKQDGANKPPQEFFAFLFVVAVLSALEVFDGYDDLSEVGKVVKIFILEVGRDIREGRLFRREVMMMVMVLVSFDDPIGDGKES